MRKFMVSSFILNGCEDQGETTLLTEDDIMFSLKYWDFYVKKMIEVDKRSSITWDDALYSWCASHWAWEVTEEEG